MSHKLKEDIGTDISIHVTLEELNYNNSEQSFFHFLCLSWITSLHLVQWNLYNKHCLKINHVWVYSWILTDLVIKYCISQYHWLYRSKEYMIVDWNLLIIPYSKSGYDLVHLQQTYIISFLRNTKRGDLYTLHVSHPCKGRHTGQPAT